MKDFVRADQRFSLCGLNCGLCVMHLDGYCPGCGGGVGNQSCAIARCAMGREGVAYCTQCVDYPCARYEAEDAYDSFISHRNRRTDLERHRLDPEGYRREQEEKAELLQFLLDTCNDGRRKRLFTTGVNLLGLEALRAIRAQLAAEPSLPMEERAALAAAALQKAAAAAGISLRLRRKPKK